MRGQNERSVLPRLDTRADGSQSNIRFANVPIFRGERSAQQLASSSACARRARAICAYGFLCTPEARHGGSRNDTQAANLRELRDQGFRDAVGKILLSRIAADIRERQHCTPLANTSLSRTAPGSVANGVNRPRSPNATSGVYWASRPSPRKCPHSSASLRATSACMDDPLYRAQGRVRENWPGTAGSRRPHSSWGTLLFLVIYQLVTYAATQIRKLCSRVMRRYPTAEQTANYLNSSRNPLGSLAATITALVQRN